MTKECEQKVFNAFADCNELLLQDDIDNFSDAFKRNGLILLDSNAIIEVEKTAKECQRTWGMGFPVISVTLLKKILAKHTA